MKLLVVDNDNDTGVTLKALMSQYPQVDIVLVFDGKSAIQELNTNNYDAVVVDIMMPDFSGLDMVRTMSNSERLRKVPIILMSSALPLPPKEFLATLQNDKDMVSVKSVIEKPFIVNTVWDAINQAAGNK